MQLQTTVMSATWWCPDKCSGSGGAAPVVSTRTSKGGATMVVWRAEGSSSSSIRATTANVAVAWCFPAMPAREGKGEALV